MANDMPIEDDIIVGFDSKLLGPGLVGAGAVIKDVAKKLEELGATIVHVYAATLPHTAEVAA
jgi:hypothetical protein